MYPFICKRDAIDTSRDALIFNENMRDSLGSHVNGEFISITANIWDRRALKMFRYNSKQIPRSDLHQ